MDGTKSILDTASRVLVAIAPGVPPGEPKNVVFLGRQCSLWQPLFRKGLVEELFEIDDLGSVLNGFSNLKWCTYSVCPRGLARGAENVL